MKFEWDEEKAERNLRKHGIDFEEVFAVFEDLKGWNFSTSIPNTKTALYVLVSQ